MSAFGTKRTSLVALHMSAFGEVMLGKYCRLIIQSGWHRRGQEEADLSAHKLYIKNIGSEPIRPRSLQ